MSTSPAAAERRVVITGVGLVSPLGSSPAQLAAALAEGRSGVTSRSADAGLPTGGGFAPFTGAIEDFGDLEGDRKKAIRKGLKVMCRETQMAVAAAQHALGDAGGEGAFDPERVGVVLGSDYMLTVPEDYADAVGACAEGGEFDYGRWGGEGLRQMTPLWMLKYLPNMPASHIAIYNDLRGPNNSLTMREASGMMAIGEAFRIIARGGADRMVAGATGTRVMPLQAVHALQAMDYPVITGASDDPAAQSRPFDRRRQGMVCGEGAGMVVLETLEAAQARGARIYGEVVGFGASMAADRQLRGRNEVALANALTAALRDARMAPSDLGHVNADGVGAPEPDKAEAAALRAVLGDAKTPVVALKSYFGGLGAGSGVVELVGSLLALDPAGPLGGALPRTLNYAEPDPACPLEVTATADVPAGDAFAKLSTTPQGQAAALCVRRA